MYYITWLDKIYLGQAERGEPKIVKNLNHFFGIFCRRIDPNIQIPCISWVTMYPYSITTDNEIFDFMIV